MLKEVLQRWIATVDYHQFSCPAAASPYNRRLARIKATLRAIAFYDFPDPYDFEVVAGTVKFFTSLLAVTKRDLLCSTKAGSLFVKAVQKVAFIAQKMCGSAITASSSSN